MKTTTTILASGKGRDARTVTTIINDNDDGDEDDGKEREAMTTTKSIPARKGRR